MSGLSQNLHRACAHTLKTAVRQSALATTTTITRSVAPCTARLAVTSFSTTHSALGNGQFGRPMRCLRCDQPGHRARDCTQPKACYNCQEPGHDAKDCTKPVKCYICGQGGHTMARCPEKGTIPHCKICGERHDTQACTVTRAA